ncbi:VIT1/CCC1 transporter family protein [Reyranella sp.]|jgi:VIT1/CCC1 family predicted Fe2+/Mn2+ transporter|uniref:VIT1/CCC1 transporter family protein n=1 Tax=Reyranella sp. TaxID=1929291 RepID=UPI002F92D175
MLSDYIHRYLDPADSLGELLFGLIMTLTVTLGAGLLSQHSEIAAGELVAAMIGCNIAWGIIDAVLYLIGSVFSRNQRVHFIRRLRAAASEADAIEAIREEFGLEGEPLIREADHAAFHRVILDMMRRASTERAHLRRQDFQAAVAIVLLVSLSAVPGALPFLVLQDSRLALRLANVIQIGLLFLVGFQWARHSGGSPWRIGVTIVGLGIVLVLVSVLLGG